VKCILIIDDEDDIREILRMSLETIGGWNVVDANSGEEGISLAGEAHPDAILLDMMMPEMDGLAVFEQLRESAQTRDIPVILLTAKMQPADRQRLSNLGLAAVLSKPFDPVVLPAKIADLLGWNSVEPRLV
jgi:CheY-like chemotaxis protein